MVFSIARWQEQHYYHENDAYIKDHHCMRVRNVAVTLQAFSILPVGVVICDWLGCWMWWGPVFRPLHCFTLTRKANTISNSANIVLGLRIQQQWHYESGQQASALCGRNFAVRFRRWFCIAWLRYLGDWSVSIVRRWEVSASRRFEMYLFYGKLNRGASELSAVQRLFTFRRVRY